MASNTTKMKFQRHLVLRPAECTQIYNLIWPIMKKGWTSLVYALLTNDNMTRNLGHFFVIVNCPPAYIILKILKHRDR